MARLAVRLGRIVALLAPVLALQACAARAWVMVPPKIDLGGYERIGLVRFRGTDSALQQRATQEFQELVLEARPGSRVVEIGGEELGAGTVVSSAPNLDELHALAERHKLDALFVGSIDFSELKPTIGFSGSLEDFNARADIQGRMSARLIEPEGGTVVWTRSSEQNATVAHGSLNSMGGGSIGVSDVGETRAAMIRSLAVDVTHDFRPRYYRQKVENIPPDYQVTYPDGEAVYVPPSAAQAGP
jgi:hypothetical protein